MGKNSTIPAIDVKKYGGKQVAILDGKIIASGHTLGEVLRRARRLATKRNISEIKVFSVPKTLSVIYPVTTGSLITSGRGGRENPRNLMGDQNFRPGCNGVYHA